MGNDQSPDSPEEGIQVNILPCKQAIEVASTVRLSDGILEAYESKRTMSKSTVHADAVQKQRIHGIDLIHLSPTFSHSSCSSHPWLGDWQRHPHLA